MADCEPASTGSSPVSQPDAGARRRGDRLQPGRSGFDSHRRLCQEALAEHAESAEKITTTTMTVLSLRSLRALREMFASIRRTRRHSFSHGTTHKYTKCSRIWPLWSAACTLTIFFGLAPCISKSCETIREPGFSFANCGMSFTFKLGSRYRVTTLASLRSKVKMSFF